MKNNPFFPSYILKKVNTKALCVLLSLKLESIKMNKWVKERDCVAIKGELLKALNKHTKKPIEHIYFDSFLYQ
jgi:hypothetical protein